MLQNSDIENQTGLPRSPFLEVDLSQRDNLKDTKGAFIVTNAWLAKDIHWWSTAHMYRDVFVVV